MAFNRRNGEFEEYDQVDAQIIGLLNCGDCPGATIVPRLVQMNLWEKTMDEKVTKVHIDVCIVDHCPHKDIIIEKIKTESGVDGILGMYPYRPENVFA